MRNARQSPSIFDALKVMVPRRATNERDKIAGLTYLLRCSQLPIYDPAISLEDAWTRLVSCMSTKYRLQQLMFYPSPGRANELGGPLWRPSWHQIEVHSNEPTVVISHTFIESDCSWNILQCIGGYYGRATNLAATLPYTCKKNVNKGISHPVNLGLFPFGSVQ